MIVIEFLVFVISSGLFCSERFRGHVWAVIIAGALATGSSLLFVYDLGAKVTGHEKQPPVITKLVTRTVVKTEKPSQPASVGKPHSCLADYPADSLNRREEGVTSLSFNILTDGTVDGVKVLTSSGSHQLDDAAVQCVANWHYRPAIKDGQLVETPWKASVKWTLPEHQDNAPQTTLAKAGDTKDEVVTKVAPAEHHPWYDVASWFSSDSDQKTSQ
jgi:TonB family protein